MPRPAGTTSTAKGSKNTNKIHNGLNSNQISVIHRPQMLPLLPPREPLAREKEIELYEIDGDFPDVDQLPDLPLTFNPIQRIPISNAFNLSTNTHIYQSQHNDSPHNGNDEQNNLINHTMSNQSSSLAYQSTFNQQQSTDLNGINSHPTTNSTTSIQPPLLTPDGLPSDEYLYVIYPTSDNKLASVDIQNLFQHNNNQPATTTTTTTFPSNNNNDTNEQIHEQLYKAFQTSLELYQQQLHNRQQQQSLNTTTNSTTTSSSSLSSTLPPIQPIIKPSQQELQTYLKERFSLCIQPGTNEPLTQPETHYYKELRASTRVKPKSRSKLTNNDKQDTIDTTITDSNKEQSPSPTTTGTTTLSLSPTTTTTTRWR
jgi:hypothetical protein